MIMDDINALTPLSSLVDGIQDVVFKCRRCGRRQRADLLSLKQKHGPETTLRYVGKTFKCECR